MEITPDQVWDTVKLLASAIVIGAVALIKYITGRVAHVDTSLLALSKRLTAQESITHEHKETMRRVDENVTGLRSDVQELTQVVIKLAHGVKP